MQLIDVETGRLRGAFVVDPYVWAGVFEKDPKRPGQGVDVSWVAGEKYAGAIGGSDDGVREVFKLDLCRMFVVQMV